MTALLLHSTSRKNFMIGMGMMAASITGSVKAMTVSGYGENWLGSGDPSPEARIMYEEQEKFLRFMEGWAASSAPEIGPLRERFDAGSPHPPQLGTDYEVVLVDRGAVRGEWVRHRSADPDRRLLFCHGGGFVMGCPEMSRRAAGKLSQAGDCAVFLLRYRLAPEHRFPAMLDDAAAALSFLRAEGPGGKADAARIFSGGASSGGGLALALALDDAARLAPPVSALLLLSPYVDLTTPPYPTPESRRVQNVLNAMLLPEEGRPDPFAYLGTIDPALLPPIFLQTGDADFYEEEQRLFAARLRQRGARITTEVWRGMPHVWQMAFPFVPEAEQALAHLGQALRSDVWLPQGTIE